MGVFKTTDLGTLVDKLLLIRLHGRPYLDS